MRRIILASGHRCRLFPMILFLILGFLTQLLIALGISPFLVGHSSTIPGGQLGVSAKSGDVWYPSNCYSLGILHWEPQVWYELPIIGLPFPPNTEWLANRELTFGFRNEILYYGPMSDVYQAQGAAPFAPPRWSIMSKRISPEQIERTREIRVIEQAVGWPVPSMYGRVRYRLGDVADPVHGFPWEGPRYEWAVRIPRLGTNYNGDPIPVLQDPILPLRPILSGTALNTGFFALLFYAVWIVVYRFWRLLTGARARERFARGECVRCGYSLGDLHTCPECGTARKRQRDSLGQS